MKRRVFLLSVLYLEKQRPKEPTNHDLFPFISSVRFNKETLSWVAIFCLLPFVFLLLPIEPLLAAVQTDGPLVGAVTDTSAKVFVRTDGAAFVVIEFSEDAALTSPLQTAPVLIGEDTDFTTLITLSSLKPETRYFYRVLVDGFPQQIAPFPSFTTFPLPGTAKDFRFAILADLINTKKYPTVPAPVYAQVTAESPAFILQIGDFDHRDPQTLDEMRWMHREVRGLYTASGFDFFYYLAPRFPLFHVYDDHDYGANNGDKTFPGRADAMRAFREYYPSPDLANPTGGIWYKFTYGQAEFFMLDLRSQRDPSTDPDGPEKSMLDGDHIPDGQKDWLKAGLLASTARWKFLISTVCFNPTCKPRDSWGAYNTERTEILDFIRQNNIQGVILISADLHSGGGIDDGTFAGLPELNVPHTNLLSGDSGPKGTWSEGIISGNNGNAGYGLVTVLTNPDRIVLEAKGVQGELRKRLVIPTFTDVTLSAGLSPEGYTFGNPSWGDFNNDGNLDLFVDNHYELAPLLYQNNGNGTFTNIQQNSGIVAEQDYHGSAWGDFDNDGDLDLFITIGASNGTDVGGKRDRFYLNTGAGHFRDITLLAGVPNAFGRGRSVAWGDYNKDGYLDLLIGNLDTPLVLYKNNGNGTFTNVTAQAGLNGLQYPECAFADYDKDGFPDILCVGDGPDILLKNNKYGKFKNVTGAAGLGPLTHGKGIAWGDYNNDGNLDLFISRGFNDQNGSLSWNASLVSFSDKITDRTGTGFDFQTSAESLTFDLYVGKNHQPMLVFIGQEGIHPEEIPFSITGNSSLGQPIYVPGVNLGFFIWADNLDGTSSTRIWHVRWSGDGNGNYQFYGVITGCCITSITPLQGFLRITPSSQAQILKDTLYRNNGDGTFTDVTDQAGVGSTSNNNAAVWGDFDNDGYLDLYVVNSGSASAGDAPNYLYRNNRDGTFTNVAGLRGVEALGEGRGRGAAWGDYDNDGFLDLFVTNGQDPFPFQKGPHFLYHNEGNGNNWLKIKLIGTLSNRQGLGTKVQIKSGQTIQYREANGDGGGHYLSQGAGPLHFGLGQMTLVDRISIEWPSGIKQTLKNVPVNQEITLIEGQ